MSSAVSFLALVAFIMMAFHRFIAIRRRTRNIAEVASGPEPKSAPRSDDTNHGRPRFIIFPS